MTFPRTSGDDVCDVFRLAVEDKGLTRVETASVFATLMAGFLYGCSEEQIDAAMGMITETVKVTLEEHRKLRTQ